MSIDRAAIRTTNEMTGHREVQVTVLGDDDTRDDVEHIEPYGFTSRPMGAVGQMGPDAIVVDVGDTSDHQVVILVGDRRYRQAHLPGVGEVVLYDAWGHEIRMKASGAVASCTLDATGFLAAGMPGLSGTMIVSVVHLPPLPVNPVPLVTVIYSGGIVISVTPGAPPWTVAPGDVVTVTWS